MSHTIRKTRTASKGLDFEQVSREAKWRSWFPEGAKLDARRVIPDDEVWMLVEAFRKFCADAVMIKVPGSRIPLVLRDAQLETVEAWIRHRNTITLKARQIGFSTLSAAFALWVAMGGGDRQIYMLSKKEKDSVSLLNKAKYAWKSMPEWVRDRAPQVLDRTKMTMTFSNDSFIDSSPTASDPIRGETAFLVIVDEWASFPNEEDAWASIQPVADIGGRVIGLSTAKGEGSFFHNLWLDAKAQENSFHPIFHPWWAVPGRDEEWYEQQRKDLQPWQLYQEYPSNPEEAFVGSGNPFFDLELLREKQPKEHIARMDVRHVRGNASLYDAVESPAGDFLQYARPAIRETYVIGADIAQGLEHGDWTVAYVMEANSGEIVGVYRGKPEPDEFAHILAGLGYLYNYALLCPEANNHGRSTIDNLKRLRYHRIYRRRSKLRNGHDAPTDTIGWLTTHATKFDVVNELGVWLRTHNVPHEQTIRELKTFRQEQKGERIKLSGSPHDDCVIALALTVECRRYAIKNNFQSAKATEVKGSIDWWVRQLESKGQSRRRGRGLSLV